MLSQQSCVKINKPAIIVRLAKEADLNAIVKLSKINFNDLPFFQFKNLSRNYWSIAYSSESTEIWVWEIDNEIAAVVFFILDLKSWNNEKPKWSNHHFLFRSLLLILAPKIIFTKIKRRIWNFKNLRRIVIENKVQKNNSSLNNTTQYKYGGIYCDLKRTLWNEYVQISPNFRRHGLALQIIKFNETRALELGKQEVYGEIVAYLEPWWKLHERFGWKRVNENSDRFTYQKIISTVL